MKVKVKKIKNGKAHFPTTQCAVILGYKRPADAISAHCKGSVKHRLPTNGGLQEVKYIPEGDLYQLIIRSKLPAARRFEHWVFDEVLPELRNDFFMNVKIRKRKSFPIAAEQVKNSSTLETLSKICNFGLPKFVVIDNIDNDHNPTTSKSN